jgi:hypothetical protein
MSRCGMRLMCGIAAALLVIMVGGGLAAATSSETVALADDVTVFDFWCC